MTKLSSNRKIRVPKRVRNASRSTQTIPKPEDSGIVIHSREFIYVLVEFSYSFDLDANLRLKGVQRLETWVPIHSKIELRLNARSESNSKSAETVSTRTVLTFQKR